MPQKEDERLGAFLSTFSIIRKSCAKPEAHELVNISPAQFLNKTQDEKIAIYLTALAIHKSNLDLVFAGRGADWALINLRSGQVIMFGLKDHQPGEKEIEKLLMKLCEVCLLYERSLWLLLHDPRQIVFDA